MTVKKVCRQCRREFIAERSTALFCSTVCRLAAARAKTKPSLTEISQRWAPNIRDGLPLLLRDQEIGQGLADMLARYGSKATELAADVAVRAFCLGTRSDQSPSPLGTLTTPTTAQGEQAPTAPAPGPPLLVTLAAPSPHRRHRLSEWRLCSSPEVATTCARRARGLRCVGQPPRARWGCFTGAGSGSASAVRPRPARWGCCAKSARCPWSLPRQSLAPAKAATINASKPPKRLRVKPSGTENTPAPARACLTVRPICRWCACAAPPQSTSNPRGQLPPCAGKKVTFPWRCFARSIARLMSAPPVRSWPQGKCCLGSFPIHSIGESR